MRLGPLGLGLRLGHDSRKADSQVNAGLGQLGLESLGRDGVRIAIGAVVLNFQIASLALGLEDGAPGRLLRRNLKMYKFCPHCGKSFVEPSEPRPLDLITRTHSPITWVQVGEWSDRHEASKHFEIGDEISDTLKSFSTQSSSPKISISEKSQSESKPLWSETRRTPDGSKRTAAG